MGIPAHKIAAWIEELAPSELAEEWDNVGLQCGDLGREVTRAMTALTVTDEVIEQAEKASCEIIIAHHPVVFRPLSRIDAASPVGRLLYKMVRSGIVCIAAHTNLDAAPGGVNDSLADRLGLVQRSALVPAAAAKVDKLVTFVPHSHLAAVREAIAAAGAGEIGEYTHCTFGARGTGTFLPKASARPFVGDVGALNEVEEVRLEAVLPRRLRSRVVASLRAAHPYEEVPIDVYPLEDSVDRAVGIGRIGKLPIGMSGEEFVVHVQKSLEISKLRVGGIMPERIERVAVVGGSGGSFVARAKGLGADALVTGDVDYHDADAARAAGLLVVDAGHFGTEKHVPVDLAAYLARRAREAGADLEVLAAKERDAFLE